MTQQEYRVHVDRGDWITVNELHWDKYGEEYGTCFWNGEAFTFFQSYDGDGYLQLGDTDIDRYYALVNRS